MDEKTQYDPVRQLDLVLTCARGHGYRVKSVLVNELGVQCQLDEAPPVAESPGERKTAIRQRREEAASAESRGQRAAQALALEDD